MISATSLAVDANSAPYYYHDCDQATAIMTRKRSPSVSVLLGYPKTYKGEPNGSL